MTDNLYSATEKTLNPVNDLNINSHSNLNDSMSFCLPRNARTLWMLAKG